MQNRTIFILFFSLFFLKISIGFAQQKDIYNFSADKLTYSQDNNIIEAIGNVLAKNEEGKTISSDKIIYNNFSLAGISARGHGQSQKMIFEVEGIVGTKNNCGMLCLERLITNEKLKNKLNKHDFKKLDNIKNFINDNNLPIDIITNSFLLKGYAMQIVNNSETKEKVIIQDKKGNKRPYIITKLNKEDIDIAYIHKTDDATSTIIYDEFNKHFDIIKNNEIKICDDIYLSTCSSIIKNNDLIFKASQIFNKNLAPMKTITENKEIIKKYLFFDYETVVDFNKESCMQEYSLSILCLDNNELEKLTEADENNNIKEVSRIRTKSCLTFSGFDCSLKFIEWIKKNQTGVKFIFVGFNNSKFDNFILLNAILNQSDSEVCNILYTGNQILDFILFKRHKVFDINKHISGSLLKNCENFKINCCSKKSFDHEKAQNMYINGELIEYMKNNSEVKDYNEYDVLATAVLFCKYRKALKQIECIKSYADKLEDYITIGKSIFTVFEEHIKNRGYKLPKLNYEQYKAIQKYKVAGRVEMFQDMQKVEEQMVSADVCSLYPYVMSVAPVYYPCGDVVNTNEYKPDKIGFYYCDIDQSNLKGLNLPLIYPKKEEDGNEWNTDEILKDYLVSNITIEMLKKYGCKVEIKSGFYFTGKEKSCDMFKFLLDFMKFKNIEDEKKKNNDPTYNQSLREVGKLLMNSLSGKVIEGLHVDKSKFIDTYAEYTKIKNDNNNNIDGITTIGNKLCIKYKVDEEKLLCRQKPIYIGALIYDYSRSYMYDYSYSKIGLDKLLYTDTDATKFRHSDFLNYKKWIDNNNITVPHWEEVEEYDQRFKYHKIYEENSKIFGSFEDELKETKGNRFTFYCVAKKAWLYYSECDIKFRFRGLNKSTLLLNDIEEINKMNNKQLFYHIQNNKDSTIFGNRDKAIELFERVYSGHTVNVLTTHIAKSQNLNKKLTLKYFIKKI